MRVLFLVVSVTGWLWSSHTQADPPTTDGQAVLGASGRRTDGLATVIAHRGSSGERPEHTLLAYRRALEQGADLIEMDLHLSQDGVLIGLHDATLDRVTNIADHPEFHDRKQTDKNGKSFWSVHDFRWRELRTLRVRHLENGKPTVFDQQEPIPSFVEQIELVRAHNAKHGTRIGLCPELKSVAGHRARGLDLEAAFIATVREHRLDADPALPLVVQSFDLEALERLRPMLKASFAFLTSSRPDDRQLDRISKVAQIIAVNTKAIQGEDSLKWISDMHQHRFGVIAWTYRADVASMRAGIALGLDGFFTDFPAAGIAARKPLE